MSGSQQYRLQIEKLKELMAHLNHFNAEIQNSVNNYRAKLSALVEQGLPVEVGEKFMSDFHPQSKGLADRNSAVVEQATSFVAHNIQSLEQLMGR
jgi:hypothetical protein